MSGVKVTTTYIEEMVRGISNLIAMINDSLATINSAIMELDSCWEGDAKNGFSESISNLAKNTETVPSNLTELNDFLYQVAQAYNMTEQASAIQNRNF